MVEDGAGRTVNDERDEIVDLVFALRGRAIALDYADGLWRELGRRLPWLQDDDALGVHPLAGVSRGDTEIYLTRRARLSLRLRRGVCEAAAGLSGARLDLGGEVDVVGAPSLRSLQPTKVLYSSFVTFGETDEVRFLASCREALAGIGVAGDMLVGKARRGGEVERERCGFSLMVHGLKDDESLRLQEAGIGGGRKRGCGIFIPHKDFASVIDI
jgi:CRISPR-associated protein Cas6